MAGGDLGSRYAASRRVDVVGPAGEPLVLLAPRIAPQPPVKGSYEISESDRLDLLAQAAFGDSTRWWVLADANPFEDATVLERAGRVMRLPDG